MIRTNKTLSDYLEKQDTINVYEKTFAPNELIITQQKRLSEVYIIKHGMAKCYLAQDNGKVFILEFFGEGALFGEIEAINNNASFCNIEAVTTVGCYAIAHSEFNNLIANDSNFNRLIMKTMATKINHKSLRYSYQQSHTIADNILWLQKEFPDFQNLIPKQDIANYLGITTRSLNRVLHSLSI